MTHNFKIAMRQLRKQGFYSAIKIGGFALGIATCLLIALYIRDELSYDKDYVNGDRLYRIVESFRFDDGTIGRGPDMPAQLARAIHDQLPEVEQTGRLMCSPLFYGAGSNEVMPQGGTQDIYEEGFTYADQSMLDMFGFPMVYGDRAHALTEPGSMVISKRKADKYFPGQDPVGKVLYLNDDTKHPFTIGGVMQDPPVNTHLQYDFLLSLTDHQLWEGEWESWNANNYDTYVLLKPGADPLPVQKKIQALLFKYQLPQLTQSGMKDPQKLLDRCSFALQPIRDIHLYSYDIRDYLRHGDIRFVWMFGAVGVFILLLACVNFINLSTARSAGRAKEVGLRKVAGSQRSGLIRQFLTESIVLSGFSFLLAMFLAVLMLPLFNKIADTQLSFPWSQWWLLPVIVASASVVGVLAGLYPAFYLSRFRPVEVLKGNRGYRRLRTSSCRWQGRSSLSLGSRASGLRNALVVFQFTTSMVLLIATFVVYRQMQYIMNRDLGYSKDQVMLIQGAGPLEKQQLSFKEELLKLYGVKSVTLSDFLPITGGKRNGSPLWRDGREKLDPGIQCQDWSVDPDYFKTMGMRIVRGRGFSNDIASDSTGVVINETMAARLGVGDPLGQIIDYGAGSDRLHIIGVVADFNFESMTRPIDPVVLHRGGLSTIVAVKMASTDMAGMIGKVSALWKSFAPRQELRYTFLDESFARMYADVQRTQSMFTALATLAIVIACLGLFALSAFMAEQRRKEIGIRKMLGASVRELTALLSTDFVRLVLVSVVIASPIAWWAMHKWLQDYTYRIDIGGWVFVMAAGLLLVIAMATISVQAIRAALSNPVEAIRSE